MPNADDGALLDGVALEGEPVSREGDRLLVSGREVARIHPEQRRIEWRLDRLAADLQRRARCERDLFDRRSGALLVSAGAREPARSAAAWLDGFERATPALERLMARWTPHLTGARVLELGGSGEVTPGFLRAGVRRIDQVDVSPGMQRVARARLAERRPGGLVVQHTTAAERLPFRAGLFDLVFSRHCLHHMRRPDAVREAARVLRPDGALLVIEPYLPRQLEPALRASRRLRRAERGTDRPLGPADLAHVREAFTEVHLEREPSLAYLRRFAPGRLGAWVRRVERRRPLPGILLHVVGGRVFVLARAPR